MKAFTEDWGIALDVEVKPATDNPPRPDKQTPA